MSENINLEELKNKFKELNNILKNVNNDIIKTNNQLTQLQIKYNQILGAMQLVGDLIANIVGKEEAQKFIDEIQGS